MTLLLIGLSLSQALTIVALVLALRDRAAWKRTAFRQANRVAAEETEILRRLIEGGRTPTQRGPA